MNDLYKFSRVIISSLVACLALAFASLSMAKTINLYDQPQDGAKVVGTIDSSAGMVTIFTPKDNKWMKVGNPSNGDVGWIKMSDVGPGFSVSQQVINTSNGPLNYHIVQFGVPTITSKEVDETMKQLQLRQQEMQMSIQKMVNDMSNDIKQLNAEVPAASFHFPMVMPVVLYAQPPAEPKKATVSPTKQTPAPVPAAKKTQ